MAKKPITITRLSFDKEALKGSIKKQGDMTKKQIARKKAAPAGTEAPDFWAFMEQPEFDNPIWDDLEDTGSIEQNATAEIGVMSEALRRIVEEKQERRRKYALLVDASYYLVICFQTTDQKEQFIKAKGWDKLDGNFEWRYLNGLEVADWEGVEIEPVYIPTKEPPEAPKDLRNHPVIGGG